MNRARAAFLDRDGIVCELVPDPETGLPEAPLRIEDVALIPGAAAALKRLADGGWLLVGASNQPAAAKGKISWAEVEAIQQRVIALLGDLRVHFAAFYLCPHHPDGVVPELTGPCSCRKPRPGMLLTAARELKVDITESWMIGDTDADVAAGRAAGCRAALVEYPGSAHKRRGDSGADVIAATLAGGVDAVLGTACPSGRHTSSGSVRGPQ